MKISKITKIVGITVIIIVLSLLTFLFVFTRNKTEPIEEANNSPQNTLIKIFKEERTLELYVEDNLIESFKIGLGASPIGDKDKEGDKKTPIGKYYICTRNEKSQFTLFLGISYPNTEDAKRGLENNMIDEKTFNEIKQATESEIQPPWKTPLGGEVGIHGGGNGSDWTWGCIALSDEDIKTLWKYAKLKTPVEIYE